ncbi:MAG TPA: site-2 protease family protein [Candidatus Limnocylindrales bacterium]|nr:site-2 protease family protein [Candidatus Limnocylindrales bacterium]
MSFKIGSVWGIPIELHLTFILLMIAVLGLSVYYHQIYSFILVVFLFVFVLFHELAHSLVARHYNIKVRKIVLYPIGGVSEIEEIQENPAIEWRVAFAGPFTSLVLGAALVGINYVLPVKLMFTPSSVVISTGNLLLDLGYLNLLLGAFNLLPAFPMDGGRVLRGLLAERINFTEATKYASYIGRILGIGMAFIGIIDPPYFLLIVVGVFVYIGATEEAEQTIGSTTLASVRVKDVMQSEIGSVRPDQTLAEAFEVMFQAKYHDALVEKDGIFQGVATWNEIIKVPKDQRDSTKVEQIPLKNISTFPDEAVFEAYKLMTREQIDLLPVVDKEAPTKVVGVLTSEAVANAYEKARNG